MVQSVNGERIVVKFVTAPTQTRQNLRRSSEFFDSVRCPLCIALSTENVSAAIAKVGIVFNVSGLCVNKPKIVPETCFVYSVSRKNLSPWGFLKLFSQRLRVFKQMFTCLSYVHISFIQICINPSLELTLRFIPSASPVMSRLTSSFTCQLISVIITTLIIHHSFTLSLQAQNLPFQ